MTDTLICKDVVQRVGYTIIDGVKIVQYNCTFPLDNPKEMRITSTRLKPELYEDNRIICRNDLAAFEDAAYELRDKYVAQLAEKEVE